MTKSSKIIFFGSGPVATATLVGLLPYFDIEAIITKPKPENHRGSVPVLEFAQTHEIPFYTPRTKDELTELFGKTHFTSQAGLVVDYGIIISSIVIQSFAKGIVNSHFSLLPEWRGADPITFSILGGRPETVGVSLMLINDKLDEGQLLAQKPFALSATITTPELTDKLVQLSNTMLTEILPKYLKGQISPYDQPAATPTYSRKLTKQDSLLDTTKPAYLLEREIRAFAGWPKSHVTLFGNDVVVKKARIAHSLTDGDLVVACGNNTFLEILQLTGPSGRTMSGADYMRGYQKP